MTQSPRVRGPWTLDEMVILETPTALHLPRTLCLLRDHEAVVSLPGALGLSQCLRGRMDQLRDGLGLRRLGVERDAVPGPRPGYPLAQILTWC